MRRIITEAVVQAGRRRALAGLAAACALLGACIPQEIVSPSDGRAKVSFVVGSPATKAAVTAHEEEVSSLDVLVFRNDDGSLDAHERITGTALTGISAEVSAGVLMDWYVIANAPAGMLDSYVRESAFLSGLVSLTDNTASSLVMRAGGTVTVERSGNDAVSARLDRYACKVSVDTLCVRWLDSFTNPPAVTLERIVLVNAVGTTPWSGVPAAGDLWYNKAGVDPSLEGFPRDMLMADYGSLAVSSSSPVLVSSPLYCMPNPIVNSVNSSNDAQWSERNTRLAVELRIDGVSNWYPVDLPSMQPNRHYLLKRLVINGPGSDDPDTPVSREEVEFGIEILPWGETEVSLVFPTD